MKACYHCDSPWDGDGKPGRQESCSHCGADLRICHNCVFHDGSSYNECREPQAERVLDKDKSNFCDYFTFRDSAKKTDSPDTGARQKFDDLFS
ncbi:MAG: hypothetical protein OEZ36_00610 [Spirochaetota bacterium]|nr:hypothetical protein [Spirochaetota bacterium]